AGNENFAEEISLEFAKTVKGSGTGIYVIGLGNKVNSDYLTKLATSPEYYYPSPSSEDLVRIYREIGTSICKSGPNVIQIIPRVIR
ncbi:MAG: hypothetical protein MRY49_03645, partial [Candidatus Pacebacteria bacterium]|nr:hypothetical protein [Candidatus Paceibacterota bacterium]